MNSQQIISFRLLYQDWNLGPLDVDIRTNFGIPFIAS